MPITHGHNGERVHYNLRCYPRPAFALIGFNKEETARDLATAKSTIPDGSSLIQRMSRQGNDIYMQVEVDMTGAINPLNGIMGHRTPAWFSDTEFLPMPPAPPLNRRSPTNWFSRLLYSAALCVSSFCSSLMRWLSA